MQPHFNSFPPQLPNQAQPNGPTPPVNSQGFSTNPITFQPPHPVIINSQFPLPFNNSSALLGNGQALLNLSNLSNLIAQQQQMLMNGNLNHLGIPQMGFCSNPGFVPQNLLNILGQVNPFQGQGQVLAPGFANLAHAGFNPNMSLVNLQNQTPNLTSVLPIQLLNPAQVGQFHIPPSCSQAVGLRSSNVFQSGVLAIGQQVNQNQQSAGMAAMAPNAPISLPVPNQQGPISLPMPNQQAPISFPIPNQQEQGKASILQQTQNFQPSAFVGLPGNPGKNNHSGTRNSNQKCFSGNNLKRVWKKEESQFGHQRSQFQHKDNRKRKLGFSNEHKGKEGHEYGRAAQFGNSGPMNQARENKSSHFLTYTEQEIKKWREERRKNFPSKANLEKKMENLSQSGVLEKEAKLRREQLKEILAKQAELGVQVAEISPDYLYDSEKQIKLEDRVHLEKRLDENELDKRAPNKRGRFGRFRNNKRGRKKRDHFANQHPPGNKGSSRVASSLNRKPTLLQKLLSADIRRDKRRLLQVFSFMVSNSFFKDWPEKPLKYPLVVVEDGGELEVGKSSPGRKGVSAVCPNKIADHDDNGDDSDDDEPVLKVEQVFLSGKGKGVHEEAISRIEEPEEGEIID